MESAAHLINAISSLAWPLLLGFVIYKFSNPIRSLIESTRSRKFTIKVGGNKLTVEEASDQQRKIINDIQLKLIEIENRLNFRKKIEEDKKEEKVKNKHILWVDDNPKNNSFIIELLTNKGHQVDIALTTDEAIKNFEKYSYDLIISDMGRPEGEKAGIALAKKIRAIDPNIPYFIFCGNWAAKNLREEAIKSGVSYITSSTTELLSEMKI